MKQNYICTEDYQECEKCPRTNCMIKELSKGEIEKNGLGEVYFVGTLEWFKEFRM